MCEDKGRRAGEVGSSRAWGERSRLRPNFKRLWMQWGIRELLKQWHNTFSIAYIPGTVFCRCLITCLSSLNLGMHFHSSSHGRFCEEQEVQGTRSGVGNLWLGLPASLDLWVTFQVCFPEEPGLSLSLHHRGCRPQHSSLPVSSPTQHAHSGFSSAHKPPCTN